MLFMKKATLMINDNYGPNETQCTYIPGKGFVLKGVSKDDQNSVLPSSPGMLRTAFAEQGEEQQGSCSVKTLTGGLH